VSDVAVVVVSHGTVDDPDDLGAFVAKVRRGRPAPPELIAELRRRYDAIGGSPLNRINATLATKLAARLGVAVVPANRLWRPYVRDVFGDLVGREKPCAELLSTSEESRSEGPRINRYTIGAHNRRCSRQVEASAELTAVEILAGQSDSYPGTNFLGEPAIIENITRKIYRWAQAHRGVNPLVSSQFVKRVKCRLGSQPRAFGWPRPDLALQMNQRSVYFE